MITTKGWASRVMCWCLTSSLLIGSLFKRREILVLRHRMDECRISPKIIYSGLVYLYVTEPFGARGEQSSQDPAILMDAHNDCYVLGSSGGLEWVGNLPSQPDLLSRPSTHATSCERRSRKKDRFIEDEVSSNKTIEGGTKTKYLNI